MTRTTNLRAALLAVALLLRPLPVQDPDRLVRVQELRSRTLSSGMEGPRLPHERVRAFGDATGSVFSGVAGHNLRDVSMRVDGPAFPATAVLVTANYFPLLGAETPGGERQSVSEVPRFEPGLEASKTVLIPNSTRATRARLIDRATGKWQAIPWPPDAPLDPPSPTPGEPQNAAETPPIPQ